MKTTLLIPFLFASCIAPNEPMQSTTYKGTITEFLGGYEKATEQLTIVFKDSVGTFISRGKITIVDSIRAIVITGNRVQGYIFPQGWPWDTAIKAIDNLQPITFTIKGDSIIGELSQNWAGFKYTFSTVRQ